jgi:hypothetical protein
MVRFMIGPFGLALPIRRREVCADQHRPDALVPNPWFAQGQSLSNGAQERSSEDPVSLHIG